MGMFDEIRCEFLPEGKQDGYQTKDLECQMDHYIITRDLTLIHDRDSGGETFDREPVSIDGDVKFYGEGAEYRATFRRGVLTELAKLDAGEWVQMRIAEAASEAL